MPRVLIASDSPTVREDVKSVLGPGTDVVEVRTGKAVTIEAADSDFDLVVVDLQIGNMGGMATCLDLRLEESAGRISHVPVLMLLDRRADVFLARRASAEGWVVKPLDPVRLRKAVHELLGGGLYHDTSYQPVSII